jgi:Putative peptidoglycan binding domain
MIFTFKESHLRRIFELNLFPIPNAEMAFFGLRGATPAKPDNHEFADSRNVVLNDINHLNPRCTLGQWKPAQKLVTVFPGSTVPHLNSIRAAVRSRGFGANTMATGYYTDYRKGVHKIGKPGAHQAFRQTQGRPIRRSPRDLEYGNNDDFIEFDLPFDNFHAAWCMGVNHDNFNSAGCQVVVGYPKCPARGNAADTGPWKTFKNNAYALAQNSFPYLLIDARYAFQVASNEGKKLKPRLRFGSEGNLVAEMQKVLQEKAFYEGIIDGKFQERTWRAVMNFQTDQFGADDADGIVGPMTADALEMLWPEL